MKTLFTLIFITIFTQTFGQNVRLYKGTINKTIKITFFLQGLEEGIHADQIVGAYKYDNQKKYILLNGFRNNVGNISLVELSEANFSGTFLATITKNTIVGNWISADQKRRFALQLTEIVATKE